MSKKILSFIIVGVMVVSVVFPVLGRADDDDDDDSKPQNVTRGIEKIVERIERIELPDIESTRVHPSSLFIGPQGEARIQSGELTALASTTITVKVWGLVMSIDTSKARFTPSGTATSSLKVGDKVNIKGKMLSSGVVEASLVHALSSRQRLVDELFQQITKLIERLRELQRQAGLPLTPLPSATSTP